MAWNDPIQAGSEGVWIPVKFQWISSRRRFVGTGKRERHAETTSSTKPILLEAAAHTLQCNGGKLYSRRLENTEYAGVTTEVPRLVTKPGSCRRVDCRSELPELEDVWDRNE